MTGIEKITARIESDAQAEAARIKAGADERCAALRAEYDKKAQDAYWERIRSGVKECESRVDRMGRLAQMESKKSVLGLKQSMVDEAFQRAVERICSMPVEEYVEAMAALACKSAVSGRERMVLCARDRDRCGQALVDAANAKLAAAGRTAQLTLSEETADMKAGFLLREGDVSVNCSVEVLAELCRSEMAAKVAAALFD